MNKTRRKLTLTSPASAGLVPRDEGEAGRRLGEGHAILEARALLLLLVSAATVLPALDASAAAPSPAPGIANPAPKIAAGSGIFDVDGTHGQLPDLLPADELQRLDALLATLPGPGHKIDSPVSPDDRTVLASVRGERFFIDLRSGQTTPVKEEEKRLRALCNYVWLDADTLGFLTTQMGPDKKARIVGARLDRRTGEVTTDEPRLAKVVAAIGEKQTPVLLSDDASKLLRADSRNARPMKMPSLPGSGHDGASRYQGATSDHGGATRHHGYDPVPGLVAMMLTEGAKLSVVDVGSGVVHDVYTVEPDVKILDATFSPDGSRFSVTTESLGDSMHRMFDGANLTEDEYKDSIGELAPDDNIFFQSNQVSVLDFPSGKVSTLRAATHGDGMVYRGTSWSADNRLMVAEMNGPGRLAGRRHPQYLGDSQGGGALYFYDAASLREVRRLDRPEVDSPTKDARFISADEVLVQTRFGTNGHPYLYEFSTGTFRNLADRPGAYYEVVATRRSREIAFVHASVTEPPEYARAKFDGTGFTRLTNLNQAAREAVRAKQHPVSFKLDNGFTIDGVLTLPADVAFPPKNVPIVVWQPGGPFNAVTNTWDATVETPASVLPNFGIGVLVTPLYGRHGFGQQRFNAIADADRFGAADIDAQAEIVDQLRARGWSGKVGIVGCSYGGYFVTQSLVRHSQRYDAGHAMCSIVDWVTEWNRGGGQGAPWLLGKSIFDDPQAYIRVSPVFNARRITSPLLAFHGTADFVPMTVMDNLMEQVLRAGTPARLLRFRNATHGFANISPPELSRAYERYGVQEQLLWFRRYLEP